MTKQLKDIYRKLIPDFTDVFVVPLIPTKQTKSSYLSCLYSDLVQDSSINIHSVSVYAHWKLIFAGLFNRKAILHYHWLEFQDIRSLSAMPYKLTCIAFYKLFGGKLVWTIHNKYPHDGKYLKLHSILQRWMSRKSNSIILHCNTVKQDLIKFLNISEEKIKICAHPSFTTTTLVKKDARKQLSKQLQIDLDSEDYAFLVFGQISHYKGISAIIEAFNELLDDHIHLIVAGPVKKGNSNLSSELQEWCSKVNNLHIRDTFIDEETLPILHSAVDCAVANHKDIISSGSTEMALSYNLTVIAPRKGCIIEKEGDSVFLFNNVKELTSLMKKASDRSLNG